MLHSLLALKMAAMVAAAGLDTDEWQNPSADMKAQVQALADLQEALVKGQPPAPGGNQQEILAKIQALAEKGDKDALFAMGLFAQQSNQQGAIEVAKNFYKQAAQKGQLQAMNNYGYILAASAQDPAQQQEGIDSIKQAAQKEFNPARRNMAAILMRGMAGQPQNFDEARKMLEEAAADGDHQAEFELAQFYLGNGGEANQDDQKAFGYLKTAAEHGNPNALAALGAILLDGKTFGKMPVTANPAEAVKLFRKLGDDQKNPAGQRILGELYMAGRDNTDIKKDVKKALEYYLNAARGNDPLALLVLAQLHESGFDDNPKDDKGPDVSPNPAVALQLYRLAAQNNVPLAVFKIGLFYENGVAVDKDMTKAFAYYLQAAGSGIGAAMHKVGQFYFNGAGTLKDVVAATGWFQRGALVQFPDSLVSLGIMAENGLVPVPDNTVTPFQLAGRYYNQVEDNPNSTDPVRVEALLRLGALHYKGLMSGKNPPVADYDKAYMCFKLAADIDDKSEAAKSFLAQTEKELTQDRKAKANALVENMKTQRKEVLAKAQAGPAVPTGGAAAPAPAPVPEPAPAPAPTGGAGKKKGGTK